MAARKPANPKVGDFVLIQEDELLPMLVTHINGTNLDGVVFSALPHKVGRMKHSWPVSGASKGDGIGQWRMR